MIARSWAPNGDTQLQLAMYYGHTREWWGQAIWFYNKLDKAEVPQNLFEVAEAGGSMEAIPGHYLAWTKEVLDFWKARAGLAETLLPER